MKKIVVTLLAIDLCAAAFGQKVRFTMRRI